MRRYIPIALALALALAACQAPQSAPAPLRVVLLCQPVQVQGTPALGCQGIAAPSDAAR